MTVDVTLRDARPADVEELRAVFRRSSLSNDGDRDVLLANPEHLAWEAPDGGRVRAAVDPAGAILGFATTVPGADSAELEDLFVDPPQMRRGIGLLLIADAARVAAAGGAAQLAVIANGHALAFYRAAGFAGETEISTALGSGLRLTLATGAPTMRRP